QLPGVAEARCRRQIAGISFDRALFYPAGDQIDLLLRQPTLTNKAAMTFDAFPRRHEMAARDLGNLRSAFLNVGIGQKGKRSNFARPMAGGAILENDRGDMAIKG